MKEIKDYLHLYLGCEVVSKSTEEKVGVLLGVVGNNVYFKISGVIYSSQTSSYKIILRQLSDMTEEEKKHIDYPAYQIFRSQVKHPKTLMPAISWAANQTFYLLSKHFDLFGLIPEGLAIDKTTLK